MLDTRILYREYVHKTARATAMALRLILPNKRGPKQAKRKLLTSVVTSQILYAALVSAEAAAVKSYMRGVVAQRWTISPRGVH